MTPPSLIEATVFVDWNTQIYEAHPPKNAAPIEVARCTLEYVGRTIGKLLTDLKPQDRFRVELRLYHGWHKGFEVTLRRKALAILAPSVDFLSLSRRSNVIFRSHIGYGDCLISAVDLRFHSRLDCHLPNTLRNAMDSSYRHEEKMVDTAMAADLVDLAHREPQRWFVVMARDDDLVPPVFSAEAIIGNRGGKVVLSRRRPVLGPFLNLDGLVYQQ